MEKHIYFVRHGETDSNATGFFHGPESMLTDLGKQQAKLVAERVGRIKPEALVSSSYRRALDTAQAISDRTGLTIEPSDLFVEWREPSAIFHRHKDEPEVKALHDKMTERHGDPHHRVADEETFAELKARAVAGLALLADHPASRICVVMHGAFLRVLTGVILFGEEFNPQHVNQFFRHMITSNTGITYIRNINPEYGWQLISWNDSAHLG